MRNARVLLRSLGLILLVFVWTGPSAAQTAAPTGPARLIVGFAPGGGNDILARIVAEKLGARLKSNVIVENRPGANGVIAIEAVRRSEPNGQTILVGPSSGMTFNPILLKEIPYDPVKDFMPIAMVGQFPLIIVVKADSPIKSLEDLVAQAKVNPGSMNYSSAASSFQMATEAFSQRAGIRMTNVPYRGSAPAVTAVLTGDVTVNFGDVSAVLPLIEGGQLRPLAVTSLQRLPTLPSVPSVAEGGHPGFEAVFWSALFLPARSPESIRGAYEDEVQAIIAMPDVSDRMNKLGVQPSFMPGAALHERIKADIAANREIALAAGIKSE